MKKQEEWKSHTASSILRIQFIKLHFFILYFILISQISLTMSNFSLPNKESVLIPEFHFRIHNSKRQQSVYMCRKF